MARLRTVYFCESDQSKWFDKREDADRYDKKNEVVEFIKEGMDAGSQAVHDIVYRIMERYEITQRWDWKASEDVQE